MSRKTNRDHTKRQQRPMMEDEATAKRSLRDRRINICLINASVSKTEKILSSVRFAGQNINTSLDGGRLINDVLWRDVAGVRELTRMLAREGFLWCDRLQVSQQALSRCYPLTSVNSRLSVRSNK